MEYCCNSCGMVTERVKYCYDPKYDELYLSCPNCGGEVVPYSEEVDEDEDEE